jgi:hypothetical protein
MGEEACQDKPGDGSDGEIKVSRTSLFVQLLRPSNLSIK